MHLQHKTALITGGGTGVGRTTALALGRLGGHVAIVYSRPKAETEQTAWWHRFAVFGLPVSESDRRLATTHV